MFKFPLPLISKHLFVPNHRLVVVYGSQNTKASSEIKTTARMIFYDLPCHSSTWRFDFQLSYYHVTYMMPCVTFEILLVNFWAYHVSLYDPTACLFRVDFWSNWLELLPVITFAYELRLSFCFCCWKDDDKILTIMSFFQTFETYILIFYNPLWIPVSIRDFPEPLWEFLDHRGSSIMYLDKIFNMDPL